ncbi:MAG TPA: WD40 repeat domain-containing protein, partial [Kofleriaceae bacterium]|nr:WD40 repeat domain-containing protein [Kofleriaceae bacterium]
PLAELVAVLDGARNAHQAHIAIQELARDLVRYLLAVTLAAHAHTQAAEGQDDPALLELVRALDRRELSMDERVQLIRLLVRPLIGQRDSHPIPALVDLVTPGPDGADDLEPMLTLHATLDHAGTDDLVRSRVHRLVPELTELLRRTRFLLDYLLVVPCRGAAERWAGVRRDPRAAAEVVAGELVDEHPALVDRAGRACLDLWPLVQAVALDDGDAPQLFVFDGNGPHGALMVATPLGVERHDTLARAWVGSHVIAGIEAKARMRDQIRVAAHQWQACDHSNALLWRGDVLEDLERWTRHTSARRLDELETSFVAASRRLARHGRWIRRSLIAAGVAIALAGVQYRATLQTQLARQHARMAQELADRSVIQAEVEEGRQALLHDESAEAQRHLLEAHRRGDNSPSVAFMLARATQPLRAEQARFASAMGRMWSAAFSPDGEQIVTTDDAGARIWSARSYQLLYTLPHGGEVYHAVYSGDGRRLVTATADAIKIWDPATGSEVRELTHRPADGPPPNYYIVAVSGDGRFIAAIDAMGARADVWNAATGVLVAALRDDASEFPSIAFSADSRWLATSGGDDVRVFDTATWAQALTIPGPHIHALGFDPTGPRLATGSATGDAAIWQIPSGARIRHLRETGEPVDRLAFAPSGELVATGARDGAEQIWSASSGALLSQLNLLHGKILAIEFDRTSKLVVAASAGGSLAVVDATLGLPITVLEGPRNVVRSAHFDPSSRRVVGASWDGTARVWDATSPYRQFSSAPLADDCGIVANLEPDQRFVAIGCRDHKTRVWDTARDRLLAELPSVSPVEGDLASALPAVSADGDRAAIARGSVVEIYELPGGRLLREVRHAQPVTAVAFGMGGHDLITGAADGSLVVTRDGREPAPLAPSSAAIDAAWLIPGDRALAVDAHRRLRVLDVARGKLLADREMPTRVRILRPSPDGRRLVTIPSYSGKAAPPLLWDLERYRLVGALEGHLGFVYSARFVDGGRAIITAGSDATVRLWSSESGGARMIYRGGSRFLADATLSPDGVMVVAGGSNGVVRFWDAGSGRALWTVQAHRSHVVGIHFEGEDLVTRGFGGDLSRWSFSAQREIVDGLSD